MTIRSKIILCSIGGLMGASAVWLGYQAAIRPEHSPVSRGAQLATTAGCFACHGHSEEDPRINFRTTPSGQIRRSGIDIFWEDGVPEAEEVKEWITHGVPERRRERHAQLLMQMPAYGDDGHLDASQIDDVTAWVLAEGLRLTEGNGNADGDVPELTDEERSALSDDELFVLGDRISRQQGCYQCHGELGQGNVPNLQSFKGYIPGFFGHDFLELTADGDPHEIMHWIDDGRGEAIESGLLGGVARRFFETQAIPMPAYAEMMTANEKAILVDFLLLLNRKGPLDSSAVEAIATTLADQN